MMITLASGDSDYCHGFNNDTPSGTAFLPLLRCGDLDLSLYLGYNVCSSVAVV